MRLGRSLLGLGLISSLRRVFRTFCNNHVRHWDTIVSFNYDVVFEYSLPYRIAWHYGCVDGTDRSRPLRILKPHGSINWEEEVEGEIIAVDDPARFPKMPILVAPTHLKFIGTGERVDEEESITRPLTGYLNQSEQIADIWGAMENAMREAKGYVFIGYSFPSSDLYFSSVLRSALAVRKSHPFVVIVNPDSMAIRGRLHSRFAIPLEQIRSFSDLETFSQSNRSHVVQMFE